MKSMIGGGTDMELLPIGSVVLLKEAKNSNKRMLIYGVKQLNEEDEKTYDYLACLYPEGNLAEGNNFLFNHEDIENVDFEGFSDLESQQFREKLDKPLDNIERTTLDETALALENAGARRVERIKDGSGKTKGIIGIFIMIVGLIFNLIAGIGSLLFHICAFFSLNSSAELGMETLDKHKKSISVKILFFIFGLGIVVFIIWVVRISK